LHFCSASASFGKSACCLYIEQCSNVSGEFSDWHDWGGCSKTCGGSAKARDSSDSNYSRVDIVWNNRTCLGGWPNWDEQRQPDGRFQSSSSPQLFIFQLIPTLARR
jgi:hypothetical protein